MLHGWRGGNRDRHPQPMYLSGVLIYRKHHQAPGNDLPLVAMAEIERDLRAGRWRLPRRVGAASDDADF